MRVLTSLILAAGLTGAAAAQDNYSHEVLYGALDTPWALAVLPDGDILITEKTGALRWMDDGEMRSEPVSGVPASLYSGQGGLMDIALHPEFESNGWVYLTWSEGTPRDNALKLGRGRFENGALVGFEEIFADQPRRRTDVHYGARLVFLEDNSILLGSGDGFDFREQAQVPENHLGTYIRLADDGTPFPAEVENGAPGVYSYGHRNPQAVVRDPETGIIYSHEHGPRGGDEINILVPGANYGWPIASFGLDYTGAIVTPFETYPGMTDPLHHWTPSIAPAGMAFYDGAMFPEWQGDLIVSALIAGDAGTPGGHLRIVDLQDGAVVGETIILGELEARLRDVRVAPDGSLLVLEDAPDGRLIRVYRD
ncbi:PQQ-dependent sugar dehydrogenase [Maricaulis sp.]|uniref:PQQ-dependent sugar dehydrogenase n=1 Tax=Maricaulis sp. TaxID=1486257 RepID=UPI002607FA0B|nr:PQQ-dependent sugar dehydrogenase [Maricaulis sp.]